MTIIIHGTLRHHCSEKTAAESKVNEQKDVVSAEISRIESMMTNELLQDSTTRECTELGESTTISL